MTDDDKAQIAWHRYCDAMDHFNSCSNKFFAGLAIAAYEDFCNLTMTDNEADRKVYAKVTQLNAAMRINGASARTK